MDLIMRIFAGAIIIYGMVAIYRMISESTDELMYMLTGKDEYLGYTEQDD